MFEKVNKKDDYLAWAAKYGYKAVDNFKMFDCLERDKEHLHESLRTTAKEFNDIFFFTRMYLSTFSSQYIANRTLIAVRANGGQTKQHTSLSTPEPENVSAQDIHSQGRKQSVRQLCMKRDGHQCVISQILDTGERERLFDVEGRVNENSFNLEIAHIIPYSIYQPGPNEEVIEIFPFHANYVEANNDPEQTGCSILFKNVQLIG